MEVFNSGKLVKVWFIKCFPFLLTKSFSFQFVAMADLNRGWQDRKSLAQCNAYMLENGIACDVKIKCHTQDGKVVMLQAHKYILVSRSPVFEAMFCGSYQESSDSIEITDIEPDVFKEVLRCVCACTHA